MPALYTSRRMETAWREAQQGLAFKAQPLTICACEMDYADIADIGDHEGRQAMSVAMDGIACAWEAMALRGVDPPSWRLARRLITEKYAGIIVPSFAPGATPSDRNIVFWTWASMPPHRVAVIDDEARLPRDGRSWEAS